MQDIAIGSGAQTAGRPAPAPLRALLRWWRERRTRRLRRPWALGAARWDVPEVVAVFAGSSSPPLLLLLLAGHALADFPLQGPFLAKGKNRRTALGRVWWPHAPAGHRQVDGLWPERSGWTKLEG
jgi:hypothetical protein